MITNNGFSSKRIALTGVLMALAVITLFLASVLPTNKLSFYALSSFFISIVIIEFGARTGWVFYTASSLLAFFVVQEKIRLVPYLIFFGIYGMMKFYIERINNIIIEYILKILYFNISLAVSAAFAKKFLFEGVEIKFPWWIFIIALEIIFIIYDYVYTLFVQYYRQKLKKILKI